MTQEYIAGELSVLLGRLQASASVDRSARHFAELRWAVETRPSSELGAVVAHALHVADLSCSDFLAVGDATAFDRQAATSAELHRFAVCAGLVGDALR